MNIYNQGHKLIKAKQLTVSENEKQKQLLHF